MQIYTKILDTLNGMNQYLKAAILIILIVAVLGYTYISQKKDEVAPTPTTKTATLGEVKSESKNGNSSTGAINITQ